MTALPKGLVSKQQLQMMGGIKTSRTNLLPSNASGSYNPKGANRITFSIPSFPNSFINTKRSYIRFKITSEGNNAALASPSLFPFKRMMLKSGRGQVLEDIDSYDVLCRIMNNLKTESTVKKKKKTHIKILVLNLISRVTKMVRTVYMNCTVGFLDRNKNILFL